MKRSIKIPWGERDGQIVHVSQVPSGQACGCVCLGCGAPLVAHKGAKNAHHFKHEADSACAESALHKVGKILVKRKVDMAIERGEMLRVHWQCSHCDAYHDVPLLAAAVRSEFEVPITAIQMDGSGARADVGFFNAAGSLFAGVEIIVTHSPEESSAAAYRSKEITCIEIQLNDERDLESIEKGPVLMASKVNECTMPRCPECRSYLSQRCIHVVHTDCWKCSSPMRIAFGSDTGMMLSPEEFAPPEIEAAAREGALLKVSYSRTVGGRYLANLCPKCSSMTGSFYLHDYWHLADEEEPQRIVMHCHECDTLVANQVGSDGKQWRGKLDTKEQPEPPRVESGIGIKEALRRMITGPVSLEEPRPTATTPFSSVPIVDTRERQQPLESPTESTLAQAPSPPAPVRVQRTRWGRCAQCSKASCPTVLDNDGVFFCATCGRKTRFIPDS